MTDPRPPLARGRTRRPNVLGFTLIEVMIVVAIIGILSAIAYPAYGTYVRETRRSDAHLALLQEVQAMERCRSTTFSYASPPCTVAAPGGQSEQEFYAITLVSEANSYTLTATAAGVQATDTECLTITIDHRDQKLPDACWD